MRVVSSFRNEKCFTQMSRQYQQLHITCNSCLEASETILTCWLAKGVLFWVILGTYVLGLQVSLMGCEGCCLL